MTVCDGVCDCVCVYVAIDDPAILSGNGCGQYKMYMSPKETIRLPFKYLKQLNTNQQVTASGYHDNKATIKVRLITRVAIINRIYSQ